LKQEERKLQPGVVASAEKQRQEDFNIEAPWAKESDPVSEKQKQKQNKKRKLLKTTQENLGLSSKHKQF
jgi:hypothetical protein